MSLRLRFGVDLRPGEYRIAFLMAGNIFLLLLFTYLLKPARDAVFLTVAAPAELPWVYLLTALVAAPVTAIWARAGRREKLGSLTRWTILATMVSLLGIDLLLQRGDTWVAYLFYAWVGVATGLTTSQFWLASNAVFDAGQAKRVFPLLSLGAIAGAVAGGEITGQLVGRLGLEALDLLPVAAGVLALLMAGNFVAQRHWRPGESRLLPVDEPVGSSASGGGIVRSVLRSRHLSLTVALMTMTVVCASFGDYIFKTASWNAYPDQAELTGFLGRFYGRMSLLSLGVQLLLANRLIRRLGAGGVLFVLPVVLVAGAAGMVLVPGMLAAMVLRGGDFGLRHSLDKTSRELLFLPIPLALKKRTKIFIDVFVDRWARGMAGVILLVCTLMLKLSLSEVAAVMLVLLAVWIVLAVFMRRAYLDSFRQAVVRRDIDLEDLRLRIDDDQAVGMLLQALGSDNRRDVLYALGMFKGARNPRLAPALRPLLDHESPEVRSRALHLLGGNAEAEDAEAARGALDDPDLSVRQAAVTLLVALESGSRGRRGLLEELLAGEAGRRNAALAWLTDHSDDAATTDLVSHELTERVVETPGAEGTEGRMRLAGLAALPEGCPPALWDRLLADEDPEVVKAAVAGVALRRETGQTHWLLERLLQPGLRTAIREALAVLAYADGGVLGRLESFFGDPEAPRRARAMVPGILAKVPLRRAVSILEKHLATLEPEFRFDTLRALGRLRMNYPRLAFDRTVAEAQVRVEAARFLQLSHLATMLPQDGEAAVLLRRTLTETQRLRLDSVFRLLALIYPARDILGAYNGVVSGRRVARATAQEFLENLLAPDHRRIVLGLLDDASATAAWNGAGLVAPADLPARNTEEALAHLASDCDPWLAACAVFAGATVENPAAAIHLTLTGDDMLTPIEKVLLLQHVDVFSEVPTDQLAGLAAIAREVSVLEGDAIFHEGDRADALYLVLDGSVRLHRGGRTVTEASRGETFGTWALFDEEPRVMDATAVQDARLLRIATAEFTDLLSDDVRFAQGVIRTVTRRLRQLAGRAV